MVANEQGERVRRQQQRYLGSFIACGVGLAVVVAWVLLAKPADGWFGLPVALVGVPCAFGVVVLGLLLAAGPGRASVLAVRRRLGRERTHVRRAVPRRADSNGVPTVVVEPGDLRSGGRIMPPDDVEQLSRLEVLIRKPIGQR